MDESATQKHAVMEGDLHSGQCLRQDNQLLRDIVGNFDHGLGAYIERSSESVSHLCPLLWHGLLRIFSFSYKTDDYTHDAAVRSITSVAIEIKIPEGTCGIWLERPFELKYHANKTSLPASLFTVRKEAPRPGH